MSETDDHPDRFQCLDQRAEGPPRPARHPPSIPPPPAVLPRTCTATEPYRNGYSSAPTSTSRPRLPQARRGWLRPDAVSSKFLQRTGYDFPRLTLQGLRRTWATLARGLHHASSKSALGHSTVAMTLHLQPRFAERSTTKQRTRGRPRFALTKSMRVGLAARAAPRRPTLRPTRETAVRRSPPVTPTFRRDDLVSFEPVGINEWQRQVAQAACQSCRKGGVALAPHRRDPSMSHGTRSAELAVPRFAAPQGKTTPAGTYRPDADPGSLLAPRSIWEYADDV